MFLQYFNLPEQPFGATPDPRFLFQTSSHREALSSLYTGFYGNRGFTVLIAEPGMGKTTLLFEFLDHIRDRAKTVFLFNTLCEAKDVLPMILHDLAVTPGAGLAERHRQLNDLLAVEARSGRRFVLVIDEAQNLSTDALEAVRLLTNFETVQSKLMQIVFSGQPQLADNMARPEVAQLLQRVSTICRLSPLSPAETTAYIEHRIKVVGYTGKRLFTSNALNLIADASCGIPRVINTLCFNSLCLCRAHKSKVVDDSIVGEVVDDLKLPVSQPRLAAPAAEVTPPVVTSFTELPEARVSSAMTTRYVTAALLVACIGLIAVFWSGSWKGARPSFTLSAAFSRIRHSSATKATKAVLAPVPATARVRLAAITPRTVTARNPTVPHPEIPADEATGPKTITVVPGDTLEAIATQNLGDYNHTVLRQIQALNPRLLDPDHIESGRTIRLPGRITQTTADVPTRKEP